MSFVSCGPYFEDLVIGTTFADAPALALTAGHAAVHQSIVGDRLRLPLDAELSARVTGRAPLAHPALVWNTAIGQSTLATRRVKANLFYRGLAFRHAPVLGDTLHTTTTVVGLRQNSAKPGRPATGAAALHIVTVDQTGRTVLDFHRCAMLPLRDPAGETGRDDDLTNIGAPTDAAALAAMYADWRLADFPESRTPHRKDLRPGLSWDIEGGDVVSSAPELARLTLNIAAVHHDSTAGGGRRLVYGGHTIALSLAQITRDLPGLVTIPAWYSCDHTAPVYESDTLRTNLTIENVTPAGDAALLDLRALVTAEREDRRCPVLDWRFAALYR
ncbi:acyl dehydratase [Nocardia seriolae]|nr:acyl dehydratase [Nocardia seriolae]